MSVYLPLLHSFLTRSQAVQFVYHLAERRVCYVSDAYAHVFGDPAAHVNEDLPHWLRRLHPDDWQLLRQRLGTMQSEDLVENVELRVAQPNGETQWLSLGACQVQAPDGQRYLTGQVTDITEGKVNGINAEKFNTKKNATLEILAHDLAGPLTLLQQLTNHLSEEVQAEQNPAVQELLTLMRQTCARGVGLVRDFVDNEFLESASVRLHLTRTDLVPWVGNLLEEYQRQQTHLHLHLDYNAPDQPLYAQVDVNKFQQVVNNVLSNALKFTRDGGHITVRLRPQDEQVVLTITDTGVGIPAHLLPVLFDKFTKARRPGLRGEHTTGLGMSVIQTLMQLHQGNIRVTSQEGQGTTVRLELPKLPA